MLCWRKLELELCKHLPPSVEDCLNYDGLPPSFSRTIVVGIMNECGAESIMNETVDVTWARLCTSRRLCVEEKRARAQITHTCRHARTILVRMRLTCVLIDVSSGLDQMGRLFCIFSCFKCSAWFFLHVNIVLLFQHGSRVLYFQGRNFISLRTT